VKSGIRHILAGALLVLSILVFDSVAATPIERSVSPSGQFILYGGDAAWRGAISARAERTKANLVAILQRRDQWVTATVINLQSRAPNLPETPSAALRFSQTGSGLKLQLDLARSAFRYRYSIHQPPEMPAQPKHSVGTIVGWGSAVLALFLTLATTASGRWVGLDGLLQFFRPRYWWSKAHAPQEQIVALSSQRAQPEHPIRVSVAPAKSRPQAIEILGMPPPESMPPATEKEPPHGH